MDRIEKRIELKAPVSRVWRALTDHTEFGNWFGAKLEGPFAVGKTCRGRITNPGYEHLVLEMLVDRIEPERLFAYRWHPHAADPKADYSKEPMTTVEFKLEKRGGGTLLLLTESGFDALPEERRALAFRSNDGGWTEELANIERYVRQAA